MEREQPQVVDLGLQNKNPHASVRAFPIDIADSGGRTGDG